MEGSHFIEHTVSPLDTLAGISLKYDVPIQTIKKVNNITQVSLYACALNSLKIPRSKELSSVPTKKPSNKSDIVKMFTKREHCTAFEAKTYLEETNYDLEEAIEARHEWLSTQRQNIPITNSDPFQLASSPGKPTGMVEIGKAKQLDLNHRNKLERIHDGIYDL